MKQLILGGARSGKSLFAENLAQDLHSKQLKTAKLIYIATSPRIDDEMDDRIAAHKARRNDVWQVVEEPINIADIVKTSQAETTILIDCLTLWINNLIYRNLNVETHFETLCQAVETASANVIIVSNELGMGLVPEDKLSREFRDYQGKLNQLIAQKVDKVAFMVAGLPLWVR
ncbi:MAG: bifunctional adenosylcobinamide kinase/adenosylcobinamide-phosphate guanylyltransferase [Alphaproteobacteria bacterium]|nr:bifunctional adenosylcobinamide kinase/adenosylcobinamide-phosphate guanylyltransferase [Alphaproteobacteria bacterium]